MQLNTVPRAHVTLFRDKSKNFSKKCGEFFSASILMKNMVTFCVFVLPVTYLNVKCSWFFFLLLFLAVLFKLHRLISATD